MCHNKSDLSKNPKLLLWNELGMDWFGLVSIGLDYFGLVKIQIFHIQHDTTAKDERTQKFDDKVKTAIPFNLLKWRANVVLNRNQCCRPKQNVQHCIDNKG